MNILVPKKERKKNQKRKKKKENYPITNYDCIGGGGYLRNVAVAISSCLHHVVGVFPGHHHQPFLGVVDFRVAAQDQRIDSSRRVNREPARPEEVVEEVEEAENRQQPVEEVEPVLVEIVVPQPPAAVARRRHLVHQRDQHRAQVEPEGVRAVGDGGQECLHPPEWLLVEELDQPDGREHLRQPEDEELRGDPEDGEDLARPNGGIAPLPLHEGGGDHGEGGEEEAKPNAAQGGDARLVAGEAAGEGDEEAVVEWDEEDEEEVRDGLKWGRGDGEGVGEVGVHGAALLDGEGLELGQDGVEDDGAGEDGDDWDEALDLLHLGHRAQPPRALLCFRLILRLDACLVQEPARPLSRQHTKMKLSQRHWVSVWHERGRKWPICVGTRPKYMIEKQETWLAMSNYLNLSVGKRLPPLALLLLSWPPWSICGFDGRANFLFTIAATKTFGKTEKGNDNNEN